MNPPIKNKRESGDLVEEIDNLSSPPEKTVSNDLFVKVITENYSKYVKKCYRYLQCSSLAEDAVQEGILAAHRNLGSIRNSQAIEAWLNQIIVRKAIDLLRKNRHFLLFDDNLEDPVRYNKYGFLISPIWSEIKNPEEEVLKTEGLELVKKSFESLSDTYRIPLLLKDYEGYSVKEISEILCESDSNVKVRIHRARIKIKMELSTYFFPEQTKGVK